MACLLQLSTGYNIKTDPFELMTSPNGVASSAHTSSLFGYSVALTRPGTAYVGSPRFDNGKGAVFECLNFRSCTRIKRGKPSHKQKHMSTQLSARPNMCTFTFSQRRETTQMLGTKPESSSSPRSFSVQALLLRKTGSLPVPQWTCQPAKAASV